MKNTNDFQISNPEMVTISRLESQVKLLTEALRLARHKRFGASSEKTDESFMEQLSFLFNEAEVFAGKEESEATNVAGHKRHKKHTYTLYHSGGNPHEAGGASSGG